MSTTETKTAKRAPRNPNHIDIGGKIRPMLDKHVQKSRLMDGKKFKYNIGEPYRKTVSDIVTSLTGDISTALLSLLIKSGKPVKVTKTDEDGEEKVTTKNSSKQVNQDLMEGACRLVFLPELFNEMKIVADAAVKKFSNFKSSGTSGTSASEKAGLVLPVPRFRNFLKNAFQGRGIRATVPVYLTAVMEKIVSLVNEGTLRELETGKYGSTFTPTALQSFYLQKNINSDTRSDTAANRAVHGEQYFLRYTFRNMMFSTTVKFTFTKSKAAVKREKTSGTKKAKATSSSAKKSPRKSSSPRKSPRKSSSPRKTKKKTRKSKKKSKN